MSAIGVSYLDYYIPTSHTPTDVFLNDIQKSSLPSGFADKEEYRFFAKEVLCLKGIAVESHLDEMQMMELLIAKMFSSSTISADDINMIILAKETGSSSKNMSQYFQFRFNMKNAAVINVSGNHCANVDVAVQLASSILGGNAHVNNILILSAVKTANSEERMIGSYGVLGDAAGLLVISRNNYTIEIIDSLSATNGMLHEVDMTRDFTMLHWKYYCSCLNGVFNRNGIQPGDIGKVLIQNANPLLITQCLASLGVDTDKIFLENLGRSGHLDSIDYIVNLKDVTVNLYSSITNESAILLSIGSGWAGSYVASLFKMR